MVENKDRVRVEEFKVDGSEVMAKVKELIRQGNIRKITIKNKEGKVVLDVPLTVGVVGAVIAAPLAAIGAAAALLTECTISVERVESHNP